MQNSFHSIKLINRNNFRLTYANIDDLLAKSCQSFNYTKRMKEKVGVQFLKKYLLPSSGQIIYEKTGRPRLEGDSTNISISHSKNYVALAEAAYRIGIDIEEINLRVLKVRNRFLNNREKELFQEDSSLSNTIAWTIKESLFKLSHDGGLAFNTDLLILEEISPQTRYRCSMKDGGVFVEVIVEIVQMENLIIAFNVQD
jgi:phosphopantetheinyl transferase